jgi:DNA mismatch repair protein MutS2
VRHRSLGWTGTVTRVDGERAEVSVRGKRFTSPVADLVVTGPGGGRESPARREARAAGDGEGAAAAGELMLLGLTVEDALEAVDEYLDRALRGATGVVRLVHGHGTGRLREAIRNHLRHHPAVADFRPGAPGEGGNGATVVTLRG